MTISAYRSDINNLVDYLREHEYTLDINPHVPRAHRNDVRRLTWASQNGATLGELFRSASCTLESYFNWLEQREYSILMHDGSMMQFTFDFKNGRVVGHRLCFIPCPFEVDDELREFFRSEPVANVLRELSWESSRLRLRTPIRFDYDPDAAGDDHPDSHMTLNTDQCRMPVFAPLCLGDFIRLIFRNFYVEIYNAHEFVAKFRTEASATCLRELHGLHAHLFWRRDVR